MKNNIKFDRNKFGNSQSGFTLIELIMVLIIISLIVVGILSSGGILKSAKVRTAKGSTGSSPIFQVDSKFNNQNLVLWVETVDANFAQIDSTNSVPNATYNSALKQLSDRSGAKSNFTQTTLSLQPVYVTNDVAANVSGYELQDDALSMIKFDGADDYMTINSMQLRSGLPKTIFIVFKPSTTPVANTILFKVGGNLTSNSGGVTFQFNPNGVVRAYSATSAGVADIDMSSPSSTVFANTAYVATLALDSTSYIYINGLQVATDTTTAGATGLFLPPVYIGAGFDSAFATLLPYTGYIGEVAIFDRSLSTEERQIIETYLGRKWRVKIG